MGCFGKRRIWPAFQGSRPSKVVQATGSTPTKSKLPVWIIRHEAASQTTVASTSPSSCQSATPLHSLCVHCAQFTQDWDVIDKIQESQRQHYDSGSFSRLCSIAQLLGSRGDCHLCYQLRDQLERCRGFNAKKQMSWNIYLGLSSEWKNPHVIVAIIAKNTPKDATDGIELVHFEIETYKGSTNDGFEAHLTAPAIPSTPEDSVGRARGWLETCCRDHTSCRDFQSITSDHHERPSRVLEVTPSSATLRCGVPESSYQYLVLSHMWGDPKNHQHLKLTASTLESFQEGISWDQMSGIYKEAIRITCALGYKYLWIDSLCIQQDGKDWEKEAPRMAVVYGNAVCNLSFLFPSDEGAQRQPREDPRTFCPCVLRKATSRRPGVFVRYNTTTSTTLWSQSSEDWLDQHRWPLFSRAWAFQEYLLSARILLIGHQNLMWQCSELFCDELIGPIGHAKSTTLVKPKSGFDLAKTRYFPQTLQLCKSVTSLSHPYVLSFMSDWQNMTQEYRNRALSNPKDRVMAFAGIANALERYASMTYLGGMWKEYAPLSLLWYLDHKTPLAIRQETCEALMKPTSEYPIALKESVAKSVPSWSWLSAPLYRFHTVYFQSNSPISIDSDIWNRCRANSGTSLSSFDDIFLAKFISFQWPGRILNSLHPDYLFNFHGLRITIDMLTLPTSIDLLKAIHANFALFIAESPEDRHTDCIPLFEYFPDALDCPNLPHGTVLALLSEFQIVRSPSVLRRLGGLVLVPAEEKGTYKRVGAWKLQLRILGLDMNASNLRFIGDRWKKYQLIDRRLWSRENVVLV